MYGVWRLLVLTVPSLPPCRYNALYSYCQSVEGKLLHLLYEWIPRNVAQLQPLSGLGEAQEQSTDVVQRMLNGVPTGEQFVMNNIIGKGGFSEVYACQLPNGSLVAVKKLHKSKLLTIQTISCISHEFRVLREPDLTRRHQNIMYIDDVLQSRSHLYIVMALGGKDAYGLISECGGEVSGIDEVSALQVVIPIISALEHVHRLGFAHRGESGTESRFPSDLRSRRRS
mmetsp:Transcript_42526/g.113511  ORF Transcript_42526/g.113511 Transcript_42526/m.113511 type:complete len:227 (-) Transcript_42526:960-1640(-)